MKKAICLLSALVIIAGSFSVSANNPPVYGDANDDGKVNAKDVLVMRKHIAGFEITINKENSDLNKDTKVNAKDVQILRYYIAGIIDSPTASIPATTATKTNPTVKPTSPQPTSDDEWSKPY